MKIQKKDTMNNFNNLRGITLLSKTSKILAKIIIMQISKAVDHKLRKEQAGFQPGKGCTDQILNCSASLNSAQNGRDDRTSTLKALGSIHLESVRHIPTA